MRYRAYVGTYTGSGSKGIYTFLFDPDSGEADASVLAAEADSPSFLEADPSGRFLYAVNELEVFHGAAGGGVSVFAIDPESGRLELLQQISSLGMCPAHLSLDRSARFLLVANYGCGRIAVFPVEEDGRLGQRSALVENAGSSVHPQRQQGPHAHFVLTSPDNRFALAADLGIDRLLVYRFDSETGSLTPGAVDSVLLDPGAGPRHAAFDPSGRFVFLVNELSSSVMVFSFTPGTGALRATQTIPALAEDFRGSNTAAAIAVDATGRNLYVSNRGEDSIVVFRIATDNGRLSLVRRVSCGGRTPRHFEIDPSGRWLFVANQDSDNVSLFRIDPESGRVEETARRLDVGSPVCIRFLR